MSQPFVAEIRIFACSFAPRSWAFCNGQLLQIAQNTALFSLIGTIYGGDGRTTTGLPNMQGRTPMHPGRGPGLTQRQLGQNGGAVDVTVSEQQMANHTHTLRVSDASTDEEGHADPLNSVPGETDGSDRIYRPRTGATLVNMATDSLQTTGGGQPHTNLQPYQALNFCISLQGEYPSRS